MEARLDGLSPPFQDSLTERLQNNLQSWRKMKEHLSSLDISLDETPIVLQFNKQDLSNALPAQELRKLLQVDGYPSFGAVAIENKGVSETLKTITRAVVTNIQRKLA